MQLIENDISWATGEGVARGSPGSAGWRLSQRGGERATLSGSRLIPVYHPATEESMTSSHTTGQLEDNGSTGHVLHAGPARPGPRCLSQALLSPVPLVPAKCWIEALLCKRAAVHRPSDACHALWLPPPFQTPVTVRAKAAGPRKARKPRPPGVPRRSGGEVSVRGRGRDFHRYPQLKAPLWHLPRLRF